MKHIGVIGAGTMGNGIAHVFAQSGYSVRLIDLSETALEKALATISKNLDKYIGVNRKFFKSFADNIKSIPLFNYFW